jgi:hypothetical protein
VYDKAMDLPEHGAPVLAFAALAVQSDVLAAPSGSGLLSIVALLAVALARQRA